MFKKLLFLLFPIATFSQSTAVYDINVTTIWNSNEHTSVPSGAHWSDLIGATHNTANEFLELGQLATTGIKDVAERGINIEFTNEINTAIANNRANQLLQDGFAPFAGNNSQAGFTNITVDEAFPLITLVAMVAPSPDWFISVNSLNLRSGNSLVNNGWKDTFTMEVFVYDAGTDSGTDYNSVNQITTPFEPVSMASGFPVNGNRMATITFTYISSTLNTPDFGNVENAKLYPNPTSSGVFSITNVKNLKTLTIYDSLGKRINTIDVSLKTDYSIDISSIQNGIYLVKLIDSEDRVSNKRLVIKR